MTSAKKIRFGKRGKCLVCVVVLTLQGGGSNVATRGLNTSRPTLLISSVAYILEGGVKGKYVGIEVTTYFGC